MLQMKLVLMLLLIINIASCDIPKIMHYIWLGPIRPSEDLLKNINDNLKLHKEYEIYLWLDQDIDIPFKKINKKIIKEEDFQFLKNEYLKSSNFGERAHILKYEILYNYGGIYVEPDFLFHKKIDKFLKQNILVFRSSNEIPIIGIKNCLITYLLGVEKNNLLIKKTIDLLKQNYDYVNECFLGNSADSIRYRLFYHVIYPMEHVLKEYNLENTIQSEDYLVGLNGVGKHLNMNLWNNQETEFDRIFRNHIFKMKKKHEKLTILVVASVLLILVIEIFWFLFFYKKNKQSSLFKEI